MKLSELCICIAVFSLIFTVSVYAYIGVNKCFNKVKGESAQIRDSIKTDTQIKETVNQNKVSYRQSKVEGAKRTAEALKKVTLNTDAVIISATVDVNKERSLYDQILIKVKWLLQGNEYETQVLY